MSMTVADVIADGLARAGTTRVYETTRGASADVVLDAVRRRGLPVTAVAGADVACVMAGVSGSLVGVPGAAVIDDDLRESIGGLAHAFAARHPAVVITCGASIEGVAALAGVTKATLVVGAASAAHWIAHACQLAMTEPWGPVHLEVPPAMASAAALPVATSCRPAPPAPPDSAALAAAVGLLGTAERPLVVAGRLCRSETNTAWIRAFAESRPAPVLVTPGARGVLPDPHPLVIGTLEGGDAERTIVKNADLIVAVAIDPIEVHPDAWPAATTMLALSPIASDALSHAPANATTVVGDVGSILEELAPRLRDRRLAEWDVARLHALKQAAAAPPADTGGLAAFRVVETARRLTPAGTIAVFDAGEATASAARAWQAVALGECFVASRSGIAGFAVAVAAAAQLERPERRVVCFTDAAGLPMARAQLETVVALGLPVLTVVLGADSLVTFATTLERALAGGTAALIGAGVH
jgi:acetolactate synthase-1/2/3 large subunit